VWASVPRAERKHDGRRQNLSPAGGPTQFLRATGTLVCYCSSTCVLFAHALGARINFSRDCVVHLTGALFVLGFLLAVALVLVLAPERACYMLSYLLGCVYGRRLVHRPHDPCYLLFSYLIFPVSGAFIHPTGLGTPTDGACMSVYTSGKALLLLALALPVLPSLVPPRLSRRRACRLAGGVAGGGLAGRLLPSAAAAPALPTWSWIEVPGVGPVRRRYALLTLSNGLRCIVASDEASSRLELAATVSSGSLDDPADLEGLAHLAEHVTLASDTAGFTDWADAREGDVRRQHPPRGRAACPAALCQAQRS
jgi:hypothetical protein